MSEPTPARIVAILALATACGSGGLVRRGAVNDAFVGLVERHLVTVRGLAFRRPVPIRVLAPAAIAAAVSDDLARTLSPAERASTDRVYARLGLVPPDTRLEPAMQRLLTTQLAAFYDPRTGSLVVAKERVGLDAPALGPLAALTGRDLVGEIVVAHELTHALQDQHWGLQTEPEPLAAMHTDRILARRALLEGDATWASFATVAGGQLDDAMRVRVLTQLDGLPRQLAAALPDVPPLLRETLAFQYRDGSRLVDQLLARGGWPAVDRAQADPPISSEQVLHPERFLAATRDVPTTVGIGTNLAPPGFELVMADTLGEAVIRVFLTGPLPATRAAEVADGWDGDRLAAFARGEELLVIWLTVWDSMSDAADFAAALTVASPGARVERRGVRVVALLGAWPPGLSARVWNASAQPKAVR